MSTELSNGVIIPEEYSDDWYDEMSINLRKLNDVITAASDNATDIQRLDTDKANQSDLATVATSGSYNDLSNKPSIPTKTSDLTNDSNFVDTSNSAVASGITSAKVTDYDTHVADTDIHVTTADKTKWNNGVSQAYVFRYSSTALVASSTNSNTLLDNTDNLKVGDKVIDSNGVLFSVTAIDTANSTFTIGTALIDLAQDSDVVHKSGDETVGGVKTFADVPIFTSFDGVRFRCAHNSNAYITFRNVNQVNPGSIIFSAHDGNVSTTIRLVDKTLIPYNTNDIDLGITSRKWKSFNGINPGALSLPNLANGIDISSYITVPNTHNAYTPPVNGWLSVVLKSTSGALALFLYQGDLSSANYSAMSLPNESEPCVMCCLPVVGNTAVSIDVKGSNAYVVSAKFFPCQGNI